MSIYREWTDRQDSLEYGLEPIGLWVMRQAALDRTHYAEVEAKHTAECVGLILERSNAEDERDEARADVEKLNNIIDKWMEATVTARDERDEARAEIEKLKTGNKDLADAATAYRTERNEARAEVALLKQPKEYHDAFNGATLQRPIGRNEHDRRISRLEAKVANLELGGAR